MLSGAVGTTEAHAQQRDTRSTGSLTAPSENTPSARAPAVALRRMVPLPVIVAHLQSTPPFNAMDYIGVERFDTSRGLYALRFLNGRQLIVVVVDGFTGRVVGRTR